MGDRPTHSEGQGGVPALPLQPPKLGDRKNRASKTRDLFSFSLFSHKESARPHSVSLRLYRTLNIGRHLHLVKIPGLPFS